MAARRLKFPVTDTARLLEAWGSDDDPIKSNEEDGSSTQSPVE